MENVSYTNDNILEADVFCNPVNLVGVMGRGLAAEVAKRWPSVLPAYRAMLRSKALSDGSVGAWKRPDNGWILQVPTKRDWRDRSPLRLVARSIKAIGPACIRRGIRKVAVPPLGCGLGGLRTQDVLPLVLEAAREHVEIHWVLHRWPTSPGRDTTQGEEARART